MLFVYKYGNGLENICFYFFFLILSSLCEKLLLLLLFLKSSNAFNILYSFWYLLFSIAVVAMEWYVIHTDHPVSLSRHISPFAPSLSILHFSISPMHTYTTHINTYPPSNSRIDLSHWDLTKIQHTLSISMDISERTDRIACNHKKKVWQSLFLRQQYLLNSF